MPRAVPAAGGCSVLSVTIRKVANAIASPPWTGRKGTNEHAKPTIVPNVCPPITFLALAVEWEGIAKTVNAVAPTVALITRETVEVRRLNTMAIEIPAAMLCHR